MIMVMEFLPKFFMDVHNDLSYGVTWSRWKNMCILMCKGPPKHEKIVFTDFALLYSINFWYAILWKKFARIFHERQLQLP